MRLKLLLFISLLMICGCSGMGDGTAPEFKADLPTAKEIQRAVTWTWDVGLYYVPEDHQSIERLPLRDGDYHLNVNRFVEPPHCINCLQIGKPSIKPDGTWEVTVTLRHPFPNSPEYTGFDVRGTIMFPATRYWEREPNEIYTPDLEHLYTDGFTPLYFSRAEDGGGQLLNADGFTMYFFPGIEIPGFNQPIFKYSKGKQASGPDPDSTVNGYKVFTNDPERRMFLVTDVITRTYHIAPPQGEFTFGYVVDACWAQPTVTPVTDPKNDFPLWANCADGYVLELEQVNPFKTGTYGPPLWPNYNPDVPLDDRFVTAATIQVYFQDEMPTCINTWLICPDLTSDPWLQKYGVAYSQTKHEMLDPERVIYKSYQGIYKGTYDAEPGEYLALLFVELDAFYSGWNKDDDDYYWPILIRNPAFFDFIYLEVIAGD